MPTLISRALTAFPTNVKNCGSFVSSVYLSSELEAVKIEHEHVKLKNLLGTVARKRLVKTKQTGKGLAAAVVIFED
jgi:hypothetical protein